MNYKILKKEKEINRIKNKIERNLTISVDSIEVRPGIINVAYRGTVVVHEPFNDKMICCVGVFKDGKQLLVENTDKPYLDTLFQDGAQGELQELRNINNKVYSKKKR